MKFLSASLSNNPKIFSHHLKFILSLQTHISCHP
jgi:hypothetical protein